MRKSKPGRLRSQVQFLDASLPRMMLAVQRYPPETSLPKR